MLFRPGSLMAAFSHGFGLMRKADKPPVDSVTIIFHRPSHNYSSVPTARWESGSVDQTAYELVATLHKHSGPEISNLKWDVRT